MSNGFPLSKKKKINGSRHLAREKVFQVLAASSNGEIPFDDIFEHVFFRRFTFDSPEANSGGRILRPDEVEELEADIPIEWADDEVRYAITIIEKIRDNREIINDLIKRNLENWEMERIATLDKILLELAIAELLSCPDIPIKVTINEAIELAKRYSTDKSGVFVNGIIDSVLSELKESGQISKMGRGLIE